MAAFETGLKLHRAGKRREALAYYQKALQADPNDYRALYWLGMLNYQLGDIVRAQNHMQKAVELAPESFEYRLGYGRFLQETNRPRRAVRHLRAALKLMPDNDKARYRLAMVLHRTGEYDEALGHYRALAAEQENNPSLMVNMGSLLDQMGRSAEAVPLFQRALEVSPALTSAHAHLGKALAQLDRFDEAIAAFETCLKLQPGQPRIYASLGNCELGRGDLDAARGAYERCLRATPGDITSLSMLAAIHNEQENPDPALALLDYDSLIRTSTIDPGSSGYKPKVFLTALRKRVASDPTLKTDRDAIGAVKRTGGLWPSDDRVVAHLAGFLDKAVRAYSAGRPEHWQPLEDLPPLWPVPEQWNLDMWAIVFGRGGHLPAQRRPVGWLSGFFCVHAPPPDDDDNTDWIEFGCLPAEVALSAMPLVHRYRPRPGQLVLFPSYFSYRTIPLDSEKLRVLISFDLIPA